MKANKRAKGLMMVLISNCVIIFKFKLTSYCADPPPLPPPLFRTPLPPPLSAGRIEPSTKFSKRGGLYRFSVFRGALLGKS